MVIHGIRITAITVSAIALTFLPFLPGQYDHFAVMLSGIAQWFGIVSLLFVPIGLLWLIYEWRKRKQVTLSQTDKGYFFAVVSAVIFFIIAILLSLGAFAMGSLSFGICSLLFCGYGVAGIISRLKQLKRATVRAFNPMPLYLVFIPVLVVLFQYAFLDTATEFSRNYAITNSAPLINDIEQYHKTNGHYPVSLLSLSPDYKPSIIGIQQFHYEPNGSAYDLYFEQPASFLQLGTQEIVMYNKLDEHSINVHAMDILQLSPEALAIDARRGYHAVHDAEVPHWKYFWFD